MKLPPNVTLTLLNKQRAEEAYEAHKALVQLEAARPDLAANPAWQVLRADAYENFALAFERAS